MIWEMEVYFNGILIKQAVMSIFHGKNLSKILFSRLKWSMTLKLIYLQHLGTIYYQICSNDNPFMNLDLFLQVSDVESYDPLGFEVNSLSFQLTRAFTT